MTFNDIVAHPGQWLHGDGPHDKIVVSSRIRLARNLRERPFPGWAKKAERLKILGEIQDHVAAIPAMNDGYNAALQDISPMQKQILVERHLVSREHASKAAGSAVVISHEQQLSIMINEEDHLRMQSLLPGLQLREAYKINNDADLFLEDRLPYAFHPELGYLTACPTNVGTGLRASAMIHLPGLVLAEQINQIVNSVGKIGLAVRGLYGEGTEALGNLFQISNQTTLGESEEEIIDRLVKVLEQIIEHEQNARHTLLERRANMLLDQIGRAFGILAHARAIASKEALNLLSVIKLGADLGMFPASAQLTVDELFMTTQPAHLQLGVKQEKLSPEERDTLRADLVRAKVKSIPEPDIAKVAPANPTPEEPKDQ
jgi:protein arginine kinase